MFGTSPLTPAYGKDYKNKKLVQEAFDNNTDFCTPSGQYVTKKELIAIHGSGTIEIRYAKLTKLIIAKF